MLPNRYHGNGKVIFNSRVPIFVIFIRVREVPGGCVKFMFLSEFSVMRYS